MSIHEKLLRVQMGLKAPKNQYNSFGRYHYRSCEDILEAVKPLLGDNGLVLSISDEVVAIADRIYIKAIATLTNCENGTHIENVAYAREEDVKKGMDAAQITGATSSYARKYALNGLFCIDDVKDADYAASQNAKSRSNNSKANKDIGGSAEQEKIDQAKQNTVKSMIERYKEMGVKEERVLNMYAVIWYFAICPKRR